MLVILFFALRLNAQRVFERGDNVIYQDAAGRETDLGLGHSPVLAKSGKVNLIRGPLLDFTSYFDCSRKEAKNWVSAYDPATRSEETFFDRTLSFEADLKVCAFSQMQLSPDELTLYLVSPVSATSGCLAIFGLRDGKITYVWGVNEVYVIMGGSHSGDLIYPRRMDRFVPEFGGNYPWYPAVHAAADGRVIHVIGDQWFTVKSGSLTAPLIESYLRQLAGHIIVKGERFPK
jgi:hypothetical protein